MQNYILNSYRRNCRSYLIWFISYVLLRCMEETKINMKFGTHLLRIVENASLLSYAIEQNKEKRREAACKVISENCLEEQQVRLAITLLFILPNFPCLIPFFLQKKINAFVQFTEEVLAV